MTPPDIAVPFPSRAPESVSADPRPMLVWDGANESVAGTSGGAVFETTAPVMDPLWSTGIGERLKSTFGRVWPWVTLTSCQAEL